MSVDVVTEHATAKARLDAKKPTTQILVVDDDDLVRKSLLMRLSKCGYGVTMVATADQAMMALRRGEFEYLLADDMLGDKTTGAMLGRVVRSLWPGTKVVVMTGYDPTHLPRSEDLEDFPLLKKPFGAADLAQALDCRTCAA